MRRGGEQGGQGSVGIPQIASARAPPPLPHLVMLQYLLPLSLRF